MKHELGTIREDLCKSVSQNMDGKMVDLFSLEGKRFLITGGTRGIGRAISLRFARAGAEILANYVRDAKSAEAMQAEAIEEGLSIELCRADLTSPKGLDKIKVLLGDADIGLSGLVHCAATGVHKKLEELTSRHFDWTFSLNVRAFFELVKLVQPGLKKGASILAVSSKGAVNAIPSYSMVGSSKGALEAFARHLAVELAPRGIRVNIIRPGSVLTDAWEAMPDKEKRLDDASSRSPIGRLVTADEVAQAAQFLCSDAASGIVGHTLVIDGGVGIVE
jgi:enoyl-[acyl-carrier protein] reductase III